MSIWLTALAVAVFQLAGTFGAAADQGDPARYPPDTLAIALLLAGPLALAFRDRWPMVAVGVSVVATDLYLGLGYVYGPVVISLLLAVFFAIRAGHRFSTWAWVGGGFVALVAAYSLSPRIDEEAGALHFLVVAGWLSVLLAVSEIARIRRVQAAERERVEREEQERRASEERLHLAQELHDVLAHNISQINVQASVALHLIDEQPERARPALTAIKEASRESLTELRTALDVLRRGAAPRSPAPRLSDLDSLLAGVAAGGLETHLRRPDHFPPLPAAVEQAAYRIVQEALTNVTRHAGARSVTVSLRYDEGIAVEVVDDGIGGEAPAGAGITGMRRRAEALGGTLRAGPGDSGGFRVQAQLPVEER